MTLAIAPAGLEPAASPTRLRHPLSGALVAGVVPAESEILVAVVWHGDRALTLTYRGQGGDLREQLVYRDEKVGLRLEDPCGRWAFHGVGALFRLLCGARRIQLAQLFHPTPAAHLTVLEPLPDQSEPVRADMLPRQPGAFCRVTTPPPAPPYERGASTSFVGTGALGDE